MFIFTVDIVFLNVRFKKVPLKYLSDGDILFYLKIDQLHLWIVISQEMSEFTGNDNILHIHTQINVQSVLL